MRKVPFLNLKILIVALIFCAPTPVTAGDLCNWNRVKIFFSKKAFVRDLSEKSENQFQKEVLSFLQNQKVKSRDWYKAALKVRNEDQAALFNKAYTLKKNISDLDPIFQCKTKTQAESLNWLLDQGKSDPNLYQFATKLQNPFQGDLFRDLVTHNRESKSFEALL